MSEKEELIGYRNSIDKEYSRIREENSFNDSGWRMRNSFHLGWEDERGTHSYNNFRRTDESAEEFVLRSLKEILDFEIRVYDEKPTETDNS